MGNIPSFITFTGVDTTTDLDRMAALQAAYPIEWGVLFSRSRQGAENRYPPVDLIRALRQRPLRLAAHLCGAYSQAIMTGRSPDLPVPLAGFNRVQINHAKPDPMVAIGFSAGIGAIPCIIQWRDPERFPTNPAPAKLLYDRSGGRGELPGSFPPGPGYEVGYAGGIGPDNVLDILGQLQTRHDFWIDMESGVRDALDRFDLDRVESVCRHRGIRK